MGAGMSLLTAESRPENPGPLSLEGGIIAVLYSLGIPPLSPFSTLGVYYFAMRKNYKRYF